MLPKQSEIKLRDGILQCLMDHCKILLESKKEQAKIYGVPSGALGIAISLIFV